jgi:glycosyltransferase involved in cell wall biosynthesis
MPNFEIIVVVDGPNPATEAVLAGIDDPRLRVLLNERSAGPGGARNRGAAEARGEWVAFLDDDDEYMPEMLERMLAAAGSRQVMLCARARVVLPDATYIWPRELYRSDLTVDDYLFDRRTLFRGGTYMSTSSTMLPREVFARTQYGTSSHNEDTTLALRVTKQAGVPIEMIPEPLVIVHMDATADSLGPNYEWRAVLAWADASRTLLTRRAYSGFCLIHLGSQAARRRDWRGIPVLLWQAFRHGSPRAMHVAAFAGFWLVPAGVRQKLRARLQNRSNAGSASVAGAAVSDAVPHARS